MVLTRRKFVRLSAVVATAASTLGTTRSGLIAASQYHGQPETSYLHTYLTKIWNAVREETAGRLNVTVYARNNRSSMGDVELLEQLQAGQLEFFTLNGNILGHAHPAANIQGIPFAFSSSRQVATLNDGAFGTYLRRELELKGIQLIPFGSLENGFKQITSVDRPIRKASDLRGFKMRVPNAALFVDFYRALGAVPKIVDLSRMYNALEVREVDGQENPLLEVEDNKVYEFCRYVGLTSHEWAGYNMLASQALWQRLPADIQASIIRNTRRFVPEQRALMHTMNASAEGTLRARGMIFTPVDIDSFRKTLKDAGFYRRWRALCGEEAWALMEAQTGPVG
jgi:TRAP-type transport system periplasmic protein